MKQLILSLVLFTSFSLNAQEGTTLEEYRYLSKGYVYQLEMGLDAQKEGYLVKRLFQASNGSSLVGLYQIGNAEPRALLVVLDQQSDKAHYVCVPNGSADKRVQDLATADQRSISSTVQKDYQAALNEFLFAALSNPSLKTLSNPGPKVRPTVYQEDETLVSRSANLEQYIQNAPEVPIAKKEVQTDNTKVSQGTFYGEIAARTVVQSQAASVNTRKKGVVAVKICVDGNGNVTSAKFTQRGSTTFDSYLKKTAIAAAKKIKFAKLDQNEQCGIVSYKF